MKELVREEVKARGVGFKVKPMNDSIYGLSLYLMPYTLYLTKPYLPPL
jgi:hypothetical protein